uniref:Uncharacterized protein n=1 Tax=Erpetoichthys calabaricus TaxID=27687 RepID=A0A8C4S0R6_ERPCA
RPNDQSLTLLIQATAHAASIYCNIKRSTVCFCRGMLDEAQLRMEVQHNNIKGSHNNTDHDIWFPSLRQAECRHHYCINNSGHEMPEMNSVSIRRRQLFLRKKWTGIGYKYSLEMKLVTVGCTCVWPLINHSN